MLLFNNPLGNSKYKHTQIDKNNRVNKMCLEIYSWSIEINIKVYGIQVTSIRYEYMKRKCI